MGRMDQWDEYPHRVVSAERVTPVIVELWLAPVTDPLPYAPGQYVLLCDTAFRIPQRSYSIGNTPRPDGRVSILVTLVDGGPTSTWAHELQVGDEVLLEGPYGTFVPTPGRDGPVLLLGAGSGLAPLRALAQALLAQGRRVTLFFSGRTPADAIDAAHFRRLAADRADFRYLLTCTRQDGGDYRGRIPGLLPRIFTDLSGWEVFTAGPSGFVTGCERAARALGATVVHTEEFFSDPQPWTATLPNRPVG